MGTLRGNAGRLGIEYLQMTDTLLQTVLKLPKAQRILLVERIWDSIAEGQKAPELTAAQKAELNRRLRRLSKTGPKGADWGTVKKRLTGRG